MKETTWETYAQFIAQEYAMKPRRYAKGQEMRWDVRCQTCVTQGAQKPKEMTSGDFVLDFVQPCASLMTSCVKVKKIVTAAWQKKFVGQRYSKATFSMYDNALRKNYIKYEILNWIWQWKERDISRILFQCHIDSMIKSKRMKNQKMKRKTSIRDFKWKCLVRG